MSGSTIIGNMLVLGSGDGSIDLSGSVSTIAFEPGAAWVLTGAEAELADGQTITGFTLGDTIVLDSFSEIDVAFTAGIGLVMSGSNGPNVTLDIAGNFGAGTGAVLHETASGGNTTLTAAPIVYTLSTSISHGLALDNPVYGSPFTITSTGTIAVQPVKYTGAGLEIGFRSATVMNMGAIYGATVLQPPVFPNEYRSSDGIQLVSAADVLIDNSGRVTGGQGEAGVYFSEYNTLINTGIVSGGAGGTINANGGNGVDGVTDLIVNAGTIAGGTAGSGASATSGYALRIGRSTLVVEPGAEFIGAVGGDGPLSGHNELVLAGSTSSSLDMGGSFSGFESISFASGAAWTLEGTTAELATGQTITGFVPGNTILIEGLETQDFEINNGQVTFNLFHDPVTLDLAGDINSSQIEIDTDENSTAISLDAAPCFCAGTRIRTPRGEVAVEDLVIGELVDTAFAGPQRIIWIGRRAYEGRFIANNHLALPVCVKADAIADGIPCRDLWVSPDHAICEGGVLIHARRLVNGVSIIQAEEVERVSYLHIELEGHHVIFAENCPTESFLDLGSRRRFQNAHEFATLYGEAASGAQCLPMVHGGFHLHNIQRRLTARAGIVPPVSPAGPLRGNLDECGSALLHGWAQDMSAPEEPVCLDILAGDRRIGRVLANEYRADLRAAGLGSGCHAFYFVPGAEVEGVIEVRRSVDQAVLCWTEAVSAKVAAD